MPQSCWKCGAAPLATLDPPGLPDTYLKNLATSSIDLTHLASCNDAPLDSELLLIYGVISAEQEALASLDTQIQELRVALARLVQRREASANVVLRHQAITSAVRRVPSELVCQIFALTLSNNEEGGTKNPPWQLGHICRSWRRCALDYSPLWNHIEIPIDSAKLSNISMLETQLLRAARAPLDVVWPAEVDPHLLDLALPHSSRWRSLCLHVSEEYDGMLNRLHRVKDRLDRLEKLELVKAHETVIPDVFREARCLREVILSDWEFRYPSPSVQIPWAQITRYRGMYSWQRQLEILETAPNLRECAVGFDHFTHTESFVESDDSAPVILPQLRRICTGSPGFLRHLTAPSLEGLYSVYHSESVVVLLPPFIDRSSCSLNTLVLMHCAMAISAELTAVLRDLTSLTYLALEPDDLQDTTADQISLLNAMTRTLPGSDTHELCPSLTCLVYGMNVDFPEATFFSMAQSRFEAAQPLMQLRLFHVRYLHGDEYIVDERLRTLRDAGFDSALLSGSDVELLKGKEFFAI
ncbi:hypothetical protein B0H16DRAFT_1888046 [Mycena metata]|uniref:F-box domain-containing protein n=1 Tax=Mycena metata TaxID=1033252 RepID=A0AAD7IVP3_9AGAR|nr:hypothetical protein B0H16DRAFT_1888046 [Mycena metata]